LILSGGTLFGTAQYGGTNGYGAVFAVNTNGSNFTTLYSFTATSGSNHTNGDGAYPYAGLILSGNTLYGTAVGGGSGGNGTVFSLSYPSPRLSIITSGTNVYLTWPATRAGFSYSAYALQSTTNLALPGGWVANTPDPVVAGG